MLHYASQTKLDWTPNPSMLTKHAWRVASLAAEKLAALGLDDSSPLKVSPDGRYPLRTLPPEAERLLLGGSISPLPLHKTLVLQESMRSLHDARFFKHEMLALAHALVHSIGNLHFGPEVGVGKAKVDTSVIALWLAAVQAMASDLAILRNKNGAPALVHRADARNIRDVIEPESIDAIITSPPYPNEKDYTRTTRLESVLLGFIQSNSDLRALKRVMIRSNTRGVYKGDDDDAWSLRYPEVQRIAEEIERRRIELGKTSGFERLYARVTRLYFGGMARHLDELRGVLRPGAQLAYVVGDQASYLQVMIRTGRLVAEIAQSLGYELVRVDLFRTRLATATKKQLREEVVVLRWPGQ